MICGKEIDMVVKKTVVWTCWYLWKERCGIQMEQKKLNIEGVIKRIRNAIEEDEQCNIRRMRNEKEENAKNKKEQWQSLEDDWIKINCDAAFIVNNKKAAYGVVARNREGKVLAGKGQWLDVDEAEIAEAITIKQRVKLAVEQRYQKVIIESDAKVVVERINGREKNRYWRTAIIEEDIKELLRNVKEVKVNFVTRNTNTEAHRIAQKTIKRMCPLGWIFQSPSFFVYVLCNDRLSAPPNV